MATIFAEQTETGSVAWVALPGASQAVTTQVAGVWSGYSWRVPSSSATALWTSAVSEFYGQVRFRLVGGFGTETIIEFQSGTPTTQCSIGMTTGGLLTALRGISTNLGTGSTTLVILRWYYLQWHVVIHDTTGSIEVKLDGNTEISLTSQDTRSDAGLGTADRVVAKSVSSDCYFDDLIINDTTDTDNVTYPDRISIEALMPNAAGDVTGLSRGGTDSGSDWGQVDERPPNDATDFLFDSVVNDYVLLNLPATRWDSVAAVVLALRAQNSDAGAGSLAHMVKVDTDGNGTADTENQGADVALSTSWVYHSKIYNRQPGATSWSAAKVNALQAGAKCR